MGNCFKVVKRLFQISTRLAAILNKSRIFNTYECIGEICSILFFNLVPARTNQTFLVGLYTSQSLLCIFGHLFPQVSPRKLFFRNSILVNLCAQAFIVTLIYMTVKMFKAVINDCTTIWAYYSLVGDEAPSNSLCVQTIAFYVCWLLVSFGIILARLFALVYMAKSYRYLLKREQEKLRKRQRRV